MALSGITINSAATLGTGATVANPAIGTQFLSTATNTLVGNSVAFNFILTSGSVSPGINASLNFRYAFSMTSYSTTGIQSVVGNSSTLIALRVPSTPSTTFDITTQITVPITGNYLYTWYDITNLLVAPITVTTIAIPLQITNQSINR